MTFLALLAALLLEQVHPLRANNPLQTWVIGRLELLGKSAGEQGRSPWLAYGAAVGLTAIAAWLVVFLLGLVHSILAFVATVAMLYFVFGFRQFSHPFSRIQALLREERLPEARAELARWTQEIDADPVARAAALDGDASAVARETIRLSLVAAQRHVFGVMFWFVILPGPMGAVAYWMSIQVMRAWRGYAQPVSADSEFALAAHDAPALRPSLDFMDGCPSAVALRAYRYIDWVPVRVTAVVFAVAGNFEDSMAMWRTRPGGAPDAFDDEDRVLVAAAAGALGVRLSVPDVPNLYDISDDLDLPSELEPDLDEASTGSMASAVGLVWRAVILWFFMVFLYTLGSWIT